MATPDPRVDAYIARSAEFARPILSHLRGVVHRACPDVTETIKWGMPHFEYHGLLAGMAAFKAHCSFGFRKGDQVLGGAARDGAMGQFGRITSLDQLPSTRVLAGYVRRAMALNEAGVSAPTRARRARAPRRAPRVPEAFAAALGRNARARATLAALPPGQQREYIEWIAEARREETRRNRIATSVRWLAEGKRRNWKYETRRKPSSGERVAVTTRNRRGETGNAP